MTEFAQVLGSDAPAPGGGSAAALSAANGISLTKIVCELTLGKKKYAEFEAEIAQVHAESARLQESLLAAIDKDTEAFNLVSAVFDMPKETEEDKAARREAMQQVLDEERYDPDAPVSTGSIYHLRPQQIGLLREKAENGDTAAAKRLWQYYSLSAEQTPENKRQADYWDAKAGGGSQPK